MYPIIFDGKAFAQQKELELQERVIKIKERGIDPRFVVFLIGSDEGSLLYVSLKKKAAERVGIVCTVYAFDETIEKKDLLSHIQDAANDTSVHGIMVQLPLPESIASLKNELLEKIPMQKDVDGLKNDSLFTAATAKAVSEIVSVAEKKVKFERNAVVIGSHGTVGKAVIKELTKKSYDVAEVDKETQDKRKIISDADLVVTATGNPGSIVADDVKWDSVIIDVGSPKPDTEFEAVKAKVAFITPVPGGVGPVTIVSLLENVVEAAERTKAAE
jgi:methylenetetrahydrofolate dehydrogenase (NADP+)/methenyltetrahydrofolate cyclohydrolase